MKTLVSLLFLLFLAASCVIESDSPVNQCDLSFIDSSSYNPKNDYYQQLIDDFCLQGIPGTVVLIKKHTEPLWISCSGKSNLDYNKEMRICDKFHIASVTKTFVAVCAMKLIEENKLRLDDILSVILPDMNDKIANANKVTVKQLLNHTSGIPDVNNEMVLDINRINNPDYPYSDDDFLKAVYNHPGLFEPGTSWSYSNTNYILLGKVIEHIEKKSLQEVIQVRILSPLGMTDTYLSRRSDEDVVRGYSDHYNSGKIMDITHYTKVLDGSACGGIISSAYDLYIFIHALFNEILLSDSSIQLMQETIPVPQEDMLNNTIGCIECGLGIMKFKTPNGYSGWGHTGNMYGFSGQRICYFPDIDTYFVLLTNQGWDNDEMGNILWPYTWINIFEKAIEYD